MAYVLQRLLLSTFIFGLHAYQINATNQNSGVIEARENACIALGTCPQFKETTAMTATIAATASPASPDPTPQVTIVPVLVPNDRPNPLDSAPDFSKDPFPPYPPITEQDGSNITTQNWLGTRLFGWKGCEPPEQQAIAQAFDDFHKLVTIDGVYKNIDWNDRAAKEFWGSVSGKYALDDETKKQIQQIFAAAEEVYNWGWITYPDPSVPFSRLWIEVRCSGGDGTGDPDNICKDRNDGDNRCGISPNRPPPPGQTNRLQAYSDNAGDGLSYSRITFCNGFFNLQKFDDSIAAAKNLPADAQRNLENWDNRARVFLHEVTHLDYFMNAPDTSPVVSDLSFTYKEGGNPHDALAHGPRNCRILTNYKRIGIAGAYPQRNADSYAWFAMAKYAQKETNVYPNEPAVGNLKPTKPPKDVNGNPVTAISIDSDQPGDDADLQGDTEPGPLPAATPPFMTPGCPDSRAQVADNDQLISVSGNPAPGNSVRRNIASTPQCDNGSTTIPSNVFSGQSETVFDRFCDALDSSKSDPLSWNVNLTGFQVETPAKRIIGSRIWSRRSFVPIGSLLKWTPPPSSDIYPEVGYNLTFTPGIRSGCTLDCKHAYAEIANSPCGHKGGDQNLMASAGTIDVRCGIYSFSTIAGQL